MNTQTVSTPNAPAAIGPYSQGVRANGITFFSGQIGIDPKTGNLVEGGIQSQTEQALKNIGALLESIGADSSDIVKTTIFLVDIADFATVNEVYARFFSSAYPARSCVAVHQLPKNALVEIEAVVAK